MSRLDRLEAINALARGFCHAAFKGTSEHQECYCDKSGLKCNAELVYRSEAINALIYLEKAGFHIVRREP